MADLKTVSVNGFNPADLLIAAGDGPTLIVNTDLTNNLYLSHDLTVVPSDSRHNITLSPQSFVVFNGEDDIYAVSPTGTIIQVQVIPGGTSYFQSGITSGGLVVNANGFFLYNGNPGPGNLMFSIAPVAGTDAYGNPYPVSEGIQRSPAGLFIYDGTPASNKLAIAISSASGTDQFGNTYLSGIDVGELFPRVIIRSLPASGVGIIEWPTGFPAELALANMQGAIVDNAPGAHNFLQLLIQGPGISLANHKDYVFMEYNSANEDGTSFANGEFIYVDNAQTGHEYAYWDGSGFHLTTSTVQGIDPTTGSSALNPAVRENWHTLPLAAGWSTVAGQPVPSYKIVAEANMVFLAGVATHAAFSTTTALSTASALPAAYRPSNIVVISGNNPTEAPAEITVAGTINAFPGGTSCTTCRFSGLYPLDL